MSSARRVIKALSGGDRRSVGRSGTVAGWLRKDPELVGTVIALMAHDDPVVAMRAADALEKASSRLPEMLQQHRTMLLKVMGGSMQREVVWHLAQMLPRLELTSGQVEAVTVWLKRVFAGSESRISRAEALGALVSLALRHPAVRPAAGWALLAASKSPMPAVAARARKLEKDYGDRLK